MIKFIGQHDISWLFSKIKSVFVRKDEATEVEAVDFTPVQGIPVDEAPTEDSPNLISSGGVYDAMIRQNNGAVHYDIEQSLTDAQKTQARTNIGAASASDLSALSTTVSGKASQTDLNQLATTVSGKADQSEVSQLEHKVDGIDTSGSDANSAANWSSVSMITGIYIERGKKFFVKVTSTVAFSRIIVNYNENNSKRIIDTTTNIDGIWQEITAPEDITALGIYYMGGSNATVTLYCKADGAIPLLKENLERTEELSKLENGLKKGLVTNFFFGEAVSAGTICGITLLTELNIPQGTTIYIMSNVTSRPSRYIITYNDVNSNRLLETTEDVRGKYLKFTTPATISALGVYYEGIAANDDISMFCQYGPSFSKEASITTFDLKDGAVTYPKLGDSVLEKMLPVMRTENLYDETRIIEGKYINNSGQIANGAGWAISPLIQVTPGEKYLISCVINARSTGLNWYDDNGDLLSAESTIYAVHTAPENAKYLQFNVAASGVYSSNVMVIHGDTPVPYVPFVVTNAKYIDGLSNVLFGDSLTIAKNGNTITVSNKVGSITANLENNSASIINGNPVFNFTNLSYDGLYNGNADEIAPLHALGTTIGANHGQPCQLATIPSHGLDNTAIGTGWTKDGVTFYVMRIIDANRVLFLSQNNGTPSAPSFVALTAGTLTNGGNSLTVTSVGNSQLYPALKNHSLKLLINGKTEITDNGVYEANLFDVVEEYDVMNPASTLQKIIARAGQQEDPVFDGDGAIRVKNTYRFDGTLSVLVLVTIIPLQEVSFSNAMFAQAAAISSGAKYYIPNSLPLGNGGYDFRKPIAVTWSSGVPALYVRPENMADTNNPVNRVIQYDETKKVGFAVGYLKGFGVVKDLLEYTGETFEIRNNTGKIYPHGVTSSLVGTTLIPGMIYQAVMFRSPFAFDSLVTGRMSMYHFALDGAEYVFADYASSILDTVKVDASLNGKKIEVIESVNTELVTDIYNDGFFVKATYVEGETCYIVAKIS